jgi:ribosomal protein L37E
MNSLGSPTYSIAADGLSITCHLCGRKSSYSRDVQERFCGCCGIFHGEDSERILRAKLRAMLKSRLTKKTLL